MPPRVTRRVLFLSALVPAVIMGLVYELAAHRAAGVSGFPLDDAWIHAQFARNIATGHGFTYTGDRWVAGSTSPAWTLLLALGFLIFRSIVIAAKVIGVMLQAICGALAGRLVDLLTERRDLAIGTAMAIVVLPAMVWGGVSGMELGLASAFVLYGVCAYLDPPARLGRSAAFAAFCLGALARPEVLVLAALSAAHLTLTARSFSRALVTILTCAGLAIVILGPFVAFDYATTGRPLPTTFYAKSGPGLVRAIGDRNGDLIRRLVVTSGPDAVRQFVNTLREQLGIGAIVVAAGFAAAFARPLRARGAWLIPVAVLASAYAMGLIAPQRLKPENFRYTAQLICLSVVSGVAGLAVWRPLTSRAAVMKIVLALVVGAALVNSLTAATVYAASVRNIEQLQVGVGEWIRYALPADARVAVNDVGAIAFFGRRAIVDIEGLVTPESLQYPRQTRGIDVVNASRPDYIAIFPFWYPDIAKRTDLFQEVHRISISDNVVSAGDTIVIYRTPWTRQGPIEGIVPAHRQRWPD